MKQRPLTIKQRKFIKEYIDNDGNGTKAALATYDTDNENVAHAIASENLQKPTVRERVEQALVKLELTPEWILNKHKMIADVGSGLTMEGRLVDGMVAQRALENVGKIANLYPSSTNSLEIGDGSIKLSWGGTDIPTE